MESGGEFGLEWLLGDDGPHAHHARTLLPRGRFAKLRFANRTYRLHPMHLHGAFFKVLARNGVPVDEPFWRDTAQWAQSLVLFGLLGVYILNLRHFAQQLGNPFWTHLVSYLNLGACSLNLATLTTRFVYPQFSLEGRRLWIVGLAPLGLARVVKTKYWLAASLSLGVTLGLILLSCQMLEMEWHRTVRFAFSVTLMTFTLTGLAVGLGVLYPNFKEDNPSKIVSGFGGTFCLVLSFLYILASVILLAFATPWHQTDGLPAGQVAACLGGFFLLSVALGGLPMRLALRRLRTFEL